MLFYKYQKPGELQFTMLRRGEIFFAAPNELNDANECRPNYIFQGTEELWQRLAQYILENVCFHDQYYNKITDQEIGQVFELSEALGTLLKKSAAKRDVGIKQLREMFCSLLQKLLLGKPPEIKPRILSQLAESFIRNSIPKALDEAKYFSSFSLDGINPTMWGHYAGAETGFVIVYGTDDSRIQVRSPLRILHGYRQIGDDPKCHEIGIYQEEHVELLAVKYSKKPPKVNAFHRLIHKFRYTEKEDNYDVPLMLYGDAVEKQESLNGLMKYSDWRYEKELRAFYPAYESLPVDVRVLSVSRNNIKGIIFGPLMNNSDRERAILCCHMMQESTPHAKNKAIKTKPLAVFQAKRVVDRFGFELVPLGTIEGPYFGSSILPFKSIQNSNNKTKDFLQKLSIQISGRSI